MQGLQKDETETIHSMQTSKYRENGEQSFLSVESGELQNLIFKGKPSNLSKNEESHNSFYGILEERIWLQNPIFRNNSEYSF